MRPSDDSPLGGWCEGPGAAARPPSYSPCCGLLPLLLLPPSDCCRDPLSLPGSPEAHMKHDTSSSSTSALSADAPFPDIVRLTPGRLLARTSEGLPKEPVVAVSTRIHGGGPGWGRRAMCPRLSLYTAVVLTVVVDLPRLVPYPTVAADCAVVCVPRVSVRYSDLCASRYREVRGVFLFKFLKLARW